MRIQWERVVRENWYRDVWLLLVTLLVMWTVHDLHAEGKTRRDQSCTLFERQHITDVRTLEKVYSYVIGLTPEARKEPFNRLILSNVKATEAAARASVPPAYCASTDVGLKDPVPEIPKRPPGILKG